MTELIFPPAPARDQTGRLTLGMMVKYWDAGRVKTRLGVAIGMERAAQLHRLFVSHLCTSLVGVASQSVACLAPDHRVDQFQSELRSWGLEGMWRTAPQGGGDLGERMARWFIHSLGDSASLRPSGQPAPRTAILIGGDCPTLDPNAIHFAAQALKDQDVVLGPAVDGGYYLIGLRGPWEDRYASLFRDIPWSTPQVMPLTRCRVESVGLSLAELETREDIDTSIELDRLRKALATTAELDRNPNLDLLKQEIERIMDWDAPPLDSPARIEHD